MSQKPSETFAWAHKLGCPTSIINDPVKKILCTGTVGFIWEDLADRILTYDEVIKVRKNVLLYQLKSGTPNKVIQCMENMIRIKSSRAEQKERIFKLEEKYNRLEYSVRQKAQKLRDINSSRSRANVIKNFIKLKHDQTASQIEACKKMKLICERLRPATNKDADPNVLMRIEELVWNLKTRGDKKAVWSTISSSVNDIEVATLWRQLYQRMTDDLDALTKLETECEVRETAKRLPNLVLADVYGKQIAMHSNKMRCYARANDLQESILEILNKIEAETNDSPDVVSWLESVSEVSKLETREKRLEMEVNNIRQSLAGNDELSGDLAELTSEIRIIDKEIMRFTETIQHSLAHFKTLPNNINELAKSMNAVLQKIAAFRNTDHDRSWLGKSSKTELDMFYHAVDLNALRKITLKGDVGVIRHLNACFADASIPIANHQTNANTACHFPMIKTPVYSLLECYRNLLTRFIYKRTGSFKIKVAKKGHASKEDNCDDGIIKCLHTAKKVNAKTESEIKEIDDLYNDWSHRTVEKVMDIIDAKIDNATFSEWVKQYDLLLYILQKSK